MLLDILNYIIKGTVIFSGWSYIISWQKKNRFRLVFETLLSALKRLYMHVCIFLGIGKVTYSKIFELTYIEHYDIHFNMKREIYLICLRFTIKRNSKNCLSTKYCAMIFVVPFYVHNYTSVNKFTLLGLIFGTFID